jgi:hypothetical protein
VRLLVLLTFVATACVSVPAVTSSTKSADAVTGARLASAPPLSSPDGFLRFVSTPSNVLVAEDVATGALRWALPHFAPNGSAMQWRVLVSDDGLSVYVQSVADAGSPSYLGTRRIDFRTGAELASDLKNDTYWYEDIVLWTALQRDGKLQMAIRRATASGGGYWLRTLDPLTLAVRSNIAQTTAPPAPR